MSRTHIDLHLGSDDTFTVEADEQDVHQWVYLGDLRTAVYCDDPQTADRVADAFRKLAIEMRAARHLPDGDAIDRTLPAGLRVSPTTEDDTEYARRRSG